ncbi:FKBP-type peptidyl-prolyl cis-trans isomerase [Edwardsiella piscicida]|uniref:Peptidyl-prolyl cis-trans isomerase n=3 Tax=Edwardsiella TaxID=635 RepID=A0A0H3DQB6_EDWTF|nr:FKBP-type peptidyl-prolyl cis-trans isomerase [Edwardsiella piscicida]ACY83431.1 putative FKBP-type peptidyl-prolyl cis-trans isomerases 2 [Edwardsiella tarda EIB202]ADM40656.1 FKBP-type peptidyl-prolyl cis-trans isomerase SlpA [Edwardsiella tarda FL6-60]ARD17770.1 peptidylprolyl isomerase [Edwardsiella piscicida]EKS7793582.1 FKBP-type peptidyl-prolyl cis-trans isomerase [Edwardsiella piscicida]EKS7812598.1 FKBP-type peptidyl-prolyl cis-trans isomerase [Edwardsiella piscicida]
MPQAQATSAVLVHFTLTLEDGSLAESSRERGQPALFRLGDGSLSPALEAQLLGCRRGDRRAFTLAPADAFGERSDDLVQFFPLGQFRDSGEPQAGAVILFTAADGAQMPGLVREIVGESVTVDFNHPLAGMPVTFDLEVLAIDPPQGDEHAHSAG